MPSSPPSARALAWAAIATALSGAALLWGEPLLGFSGAEVYGHAWVQWWHARALPAWPDSPAALLPGVKVWTVIDLVPTAIGALAGRLAGLVAGWNATLLAAIALAGLGGADLARRTGGDPRVGAVALAAAPALQGAASSGLTEDLMVGLSALALARIGDPDLRKAALAGVLLGATAWCGLVLAWATGLAALLLGLVLVARERSRWKSLAVSAGLTALVVAPVALLHATRLGGRGHRMGAVLRQQEPLWRLNPWHGADLASFLVPGPVDPGNALVRLHPGYLGLSLLALAFLAKRSRWWLMVLALVALAPGRQLALAGRPLGLPNPAVAVADLLPFADLINHHGRMLVVAAVGLSALAAQGAMRVPARWRALLPGILLLDLALLSPVGLPLPTAPRPTLLVNDCQRAPEPAATAAHPCVGSLPGGTVLHLPLAGPGVHFQRPLMFQTQHERPILLNPNQPGLPPDLAQTPTGRWLNGVAFPDPPPAPDVLELPRSVATIVVEEPWVDRVEAALGPPTLRAADGAAWDVARGAP